METIDSQAREDIGKLYFRLGELAMDYWGPNKDNGRRSELHDLLDEFQTLKEKLQHYIDVERKATCEGMKEFAKRDAFKAEIEEEVSEVKAAEINAGTTRTTVGWQSITQIVISLISLAGILVVAFK